MSGPATFGPILLLLRPEDVSYYLVLLSAAVVGKQGVSGHTTARIIMLNTTSQARTKRHAMTQPRIRMDLLFRASATAKVAVVSAKHESAE